MQQQHFYDFDASIGRLVEHLAASRRELVREIADDFERRSAWVRSRGGRYNGERVACKARGGTVTLSETHGQFVGRR